MSGSGINLTVPTQARGTFAESFSGSTATVPVAENYPHWMMTGGASHSAGAVYCTRIHLVPGTYTTVSFWVVTQGVTLANTFFALYGVGASGASVSRLAVSSDISTPLAAFTNNSFGTATLNYTCTTEGDYFLAYLFGSAATPVSFGSMSPISASALIGVTPILACGHSSASLTAMPDPLTVSTPSSTRNVWLRYS